jgi:threonine aldolase
MSNKIAGIIKSKGFAFQVEPCSNQLFPILPNSLLEELEKEFSFIRNEKIDDDHTAIRLVTSWATTNESVEALGKFFENVNNK